jgi:hypothetical protein
MSRIIALAELLRDLAQAAQLPAPVRKLTLSRNPNR